MPPTAPIELLAPAGSFESLQAAIQAGADGIYFGVEQLNMRARATSNFKLADLKKIATICHKNNIKAYLALNTILYDHDLQLTNKICLAAKKANIDAAIVSDIAAMTIARKHNLTVHISTQANVSNIEAVKFYAQFADTIVLARELTLQQIKAITHAIKQENIRGPNKELIKIEIFIHGALCVAISGKCYMSLATSNASANRGACLQNCRKAYIVTDEETGEQLKIENKYVMSPSDLCTIEFLDKLVESGATIFKIEGRAKGPEYVYTTTKVYKEALDSILQDTYGKTKIQAWLAHLQSVYNRGFWQGGYYLGKKINEWSAAYGSKATHEKIGVGYILNYFSKPNVAEIQLQESDLFVGDKIIITGPTTGIIESTVNTIFLNNQIVTTARQGSSVTINVVSKVRKNDRVFKIKERK